MPTPMHDASIPHSTLDQWYSGSALQKLTTSDSLDWNNARLEIAQHEPVREMVYSPYLDVDAFAFLLDGSALMQMRIPDGKLLNQRVNPGTLQLLPHHTVFGGKWDAPWTFGVLTLNRGMIRDTSAALLRGDPEKIELQPTYGFNNALLYALAAELANEMQRANPFGSLYAESLTITLTLYLLRHYSAGRVAGELPNNRLPSAQLRMIDDYIHAHVDQKISLADLANCLHLSVPHFERMFRATTQRPPYRYVLELRLERAKAFLKTSHIPIAEVARQCGFSSQSHFTTHFTRHVGISPARFARGVRK